MGALFLLLSSSYRTSALSCTSYDKSTADIMENPGLISEKERLRSSCPYVFVVVTLILRASVHTALSERFLLENITKNGAI